MRQEEINDIAQRISRLWNERRRVKQENVYAMKQKFLHELDLVRMYEDSNLQEKVLSIIPIDRLHSEAEEMLKLEEKLTFREVLLKALLKWFKHEFFTWVNQVPCDNCTGQTEPRGFGHPLPEELKYGARRVELYFCTRCQLMSRFPRYNHPEIMLEPRNRRGRCGEWANMFTLFCRTMGYDTRYVLDFTDHVWTECYSEHLKRWVHMDSCEAAFDAPLVYEAGWGKKLSYIIAFSVDEVVDVTRRYTRNFSDLLCRRTEISEHNLAELISDLNSKLQMTMSQERKDLVMKRSINEQIELNAHKGDVKEGESQGRQSGSVEWRLKRGEMGRQKSSVIIPDNCKHLIKYPWSSKDFFCNGSASVGIDSICLTPNKTDCVGSVWFKSQISLNRVVFIEFSFKITGNNGADGFAFVIQNDERGIYALGMGGSELGFGGISNSIAIEFDTYKSADRCNDPDGNHISVHTRGSKPNSAHHSASIALSKAEDGIPPLANGHEYSVFVELNATRLKLSLTDSVSNNPDAIGQSYIPLLEVANLDTHIPTLTSDKFYVGFTASTGGLCQRHEILKFTLRQ